MIRRKLLIILIICLTSGLLTAEPLQHNKSKQKQAKHPAIKSILYGKVIKTMDAAGYTYAEVNTGKSNVWAAGPKSKIKIGDMISFNTKMSMTKFHSKALKRDFPVIYFVNQFTSGKDGPAKTTANKLSPHAKLKKQTKAKLLKGIKKVKGGKTINEIYSNQKKLNTKIIKVRGKITKSTTNVMNKNWFHIRDSSTLKDLTITTSSNAKMGDIVVFKGNLNLNKDFGYGYVYPVIMTNAKILK